MRQNCDIDYQDADDMAKDTKYLRFRGNSWYFDFLIPSRLKKNFQADRIRHSLNTSDYKQARYMRDKYLIPALTANTALEVLENISALIDATELDLQTSLRDLKTFINRKTDEQSLMLRELCDAFLAAYGKGGFADASLRKIQAGANALCAILGENLSADKVVKEDMTVFRDSLLQMPVGWQKMNNGIEPVSEGDEPVKTVHPNTVKKNLAIAKRIFAWGINEGKLNLRINPVEGVEVIAAGREKHKRPPSPPEVQALLQMPLPRSNKFGRDAWEKLPFVARYSGCRIGELAMLTGADIIHKNGILCISISGNGGNRRLKTESSERLVPVSDKLKPVIDGLKQQHGNGALFPHCGHWRDKRGVIIKSAHYFLKAYNRAAKKVAEDQSFHCWRAYANTQMADAGVDILDREAILGHKSDRVQKAYTADNLKRWKSAVDKIE